MKVIFAISISFAFVLVACREDVIEQSNAFDGQYDGNMRYRYYPQSATPTIDSTYATSISVLWDAGFYIILNDTIHQSELTDSSWSYSICCGTWRGYTFDGDSLFYYKGDDVMGYENSYTFRGKNYD